jgi:hypothetical protein
MYVHTYIALEVIESNPTIKVYRYTIEEVENVCILMVLLFRHSNGALNMDNKD